MTEKTPDELLAEAQSLREQGMAMESVILETITSENGRFRRRNFVLISMVFVLVVLALVREARSAWTTQPLLDRIEEAVTGIEANQEGINALVDFVEEVRQSSSGESESERLVGQLIRILCTSEDPLRQRACEELGYRPVIANPE